MCLGAPGDASNESVDFIEQAVQRGFGGIDGGLLSDLLRDLQRALCDFRYLRKRSDGVSEGGDSSLERLGEEAGGLEGVPHRSESSRDSW